jgi:hypothetical protein
LIGVVESEELSDKLMPILPSEDWEGFSKNPFDFFIFISGIYPEAKLELDKNSVDILLLF